MFLINAKQAQESLAAVINYLNVALQISNSRDDFEIQIKPQSLRKD